MKQGKTLNELATEIERQNNQKKDYLADTKALSIVVDDKKPKILLNDSNLSMTKNCHGQIASRLKIPKPYYDRMLKKSPDLLATNINHWFTENSEKRMVRCLDGKARAFLSERYRALDNYELMGAVLPVLSEHNVKIVSTDVTESRLYIKILFPEMETEVDGSTQVNDVVQAGLVISNSEVGAGSLRVEPLVYRLVCTNGMITNSTMKKYHVGRGSGTSFEDVQELLRDETKQLSDKAFWMQVQDVIRSSINRDVFLANVSKLTEATQQKLEGNPQATIELVTKQFNLTQDNGNDIMRHLVEGGDLSRWGLANAVTRTANDQQSYEDATTLERAGGKIIELGQTEWTKIAKAA